MELILKTRTTDSPSHIDPLIARLDMERDSDLPETADQHDEQVNLFLSCQQYLSQREAIIASQPERGIRALLQGKVGSGKTMAAQWIATRLNRDIFKLELFAVVNEYAAQATGHLSRLLDETEVLDCLLYIDTGTAFFDEAPNEENTEGKFVTSALVYLLKRLESYNGIVLLSAQSESQADPVLRKAFDHYLFFS